MDLQNGESSLNRLPATTVKLIGSAQVITSVSSVIKELMENSIDAGATNIEIKLENNGLDKIEVKDNGCGIKKEDVQLMCQRSYTSKIRDFSDLDKLNSYGFRGEALSSLCAVGQVAVITKTNNDEVGHTYNFNNNGEVISSNITHFNKGTSIIVKDLFKNLPVRKQFLTNGKRRSEELKRVECLVKSLALINHGIRVCLSHNKFTIWQKSGVCSLMQSFVQVLPPTIVKQLHEIHHEDKKLNVNITLMVPNKECNVASTCYGNAMNATFLFINSRSVRDKPIEKAIQEEIHQFFGSNIPVNKYPTCLASIILPPDGLDVNLEPNKTKVMIKDSDVLIKLIKNLLVGYYIGQMEPPRPSEVEEQKPKTPSKRKKSDDDLIEVKAKVPKTNLFDDDLNFETNQSQEENIEINPDINNFELSQSQKTNDSGEQIDCPENSTISQDIQVNSEVEKLSNSSVEVNENTRNLSPVEERQCQADSVVGAFNSSNEFIENVPKESTEARVMPETETVSSIFFSQEVNNEEMDPVETPVGTEQVNLFARPDDIEEDLDLDLTLEIKQKEPFTDEEAFEHLEYTVFKNDNAHKMTSTTNSEALLESCDKNEEVGSLAKETKPDDDAEISLSAWSKGEIKFKGNVVEGTTVVASNVTESNSNPSDLLIASSPSGTQLSFDRSVSSQMGRKDMSAFTKFARDMRSKIIKQTPGITFTKIASELANRWRDLQDDQKKAYAELAAAEKAKAQVKKELSRSTLQNIVKKREERPLKKLYPKVCHRKLSLDSIKQAIKDRDESMKKYECLEIIANLNEDLAIVKDKNNSITIFSSCRLNEAIKLFNNILHMTVPIKVLEKNIPVQKEVIGEDLWEVLEEMETTFDDSLNKTIISDERVTKNGFRIEKVEDLQNKYYITDVPMNISFFGINELQEILEVIKAKKDCKLKPCRPLKVISYIRSETIRSIAINNPKVSSSYILDVYKYWNEKVKNDCCNCPHFYPVSKTLYPIGQ